MNRKTFAILAVVAVLLAAVAFLAQRGGDTAAIAGDSAGQLFVPGLAEQLEGIAAIEIRGAGDARLARIERPGEQWVVAEQDGYAAAPGKISALLIALAEARIVEEKTADPEFHSRLGVEAVDAAEATGLEVTLTGSDGTSFELILGDAYGDGERYARLAASAQSVLIDRNPDVARDPAEWVRPEIVAIPSGRVQRVQIDHAGGERLVIRKDARELTDFQVESVPEGRELQYAGIANVSGSVLQNLELEAVSRQPEAPGETLATTEFRTFDGLVLTVTATAAEEADGEPWLSFAARFDAEQALAFAAESVDDVGADPAPDNDAAANDTDAETAAAADPAADGEPADDAIAEAAELNARLAGWRYRIPAYQYSQMTRRMEDLLRAPPSE
jgi:Domain of unknown function (DUF4340)